MKAQTIDRIELTRRKMAFREAMRHGHGIMAEVTKDNVKVWQDYFGGVPAYPGAEEHTEPQFHGEKCPFHGKKCSFNDKICPFCG